MSTILNSTELILHIPKKGIKKKKLINEIMKMRCLTNREVESSIKIALDKKTIINNNGILKYSPSINFIK